MAKYEIVCPYCGVSNQVFTSIFSKMNILCSCGKKFNVKKNRIRSTVCIHCNKEVTYDQKKKERAVCIHCGEKLFSLVSITCPVCACEIKTNSSDNISKCPVCGSCINVQNEFNKQNNKDSLIIKYQSDKEYLVYKYPVSSFKYDAELLVYENQEAILFKNGKAYDLYGAGKHKMSLLKDDNCLSEVYFINMLPTVGTKWGTDSKIKMFDPYSKMYIEIGACGRFNLKIINSRKLVLKLNGINREFNFNDDLIKYLKAIIISQIKSVFVRVISDNDINVLEVDKHLRIINKVLLDEINILLDDYGLMVDGFYVENIVMPDDDPNFKKMKELYAKRYLKLEEQRIINEEIKLVGEGKVIAAKYEKEAKLINDESLCGKKKEDNHE